MGVFVEEEEKEGEERWVWKAGRREVWEKMSRAVVVRVRVRVSSSIMMVVLVVVKKWWWWRDLVGI